MSKEREMIRIVGSDLSHHNMKEDILTGMSFYFMKATEGATWKDNAMTSLMIRTWGANIGGFNPIYGFYHYARPDLKNTAEYEAAHYLKTIESHIGSCLMALDWEKNSENHPLQWALNWLCHVHKECRVKPFFYANASYLEKVKDTCIMREILERGFPIWVAHYGDEDKYTTFKKKGNIWQFTNIPQDLDIYYGSYMELAMHALPDMR